MSSDKISPSAVWRKTTINQKAASTTAANSKPNRISATATATIRTRSPRKIKTQIAKLVYDPLTTTKPNRDVIVNENETLPTASTVVVDEDEFQKKREDRDREVKEIQEMLNEITNTPTKEKKDVAEKEEEAKEKKEIVIETTNQAQQPISIRRSKTEMNLRIPTTRRSQLRSGSQTTRSRSTHMGEKENTSPKDRQKKYSSEEARRFMQEQKKKRKTLQTAQAQATDRKTVIDKSEIKKRLENLRKNTRQILDKNVKMAKKKTGTSPKSAEMAKDDAQQALSRDLAQELEIRLETARVDIWSERPQKRNTPTEKSQDHAPLSENYKKVGLLRKPEFKDHSFSAIKDYNMDKENLILDILTPQIVDRPTSRAIEVITVEPKKPEVILNENNLDLEQKKSEVTSLSTKRSHIPELDLRMPEAKLKTRTSLREKSVQVDRSASSKLPQPQQKNAELPYWLKPSAVQAYPYNFIMAVRKKLEAIANPPAVASSSIEHQSKRRATETPLSYPKYNRTNNVKRRLIDNEEKSLTKSLEKSILSKENLTELQLSKSLSEVTSNFSSISIQLPESNGSSMKSKTQKRPMEQRKPLQFDEDDTTVSSSIFSSPEKKKNLNERSKNFTTSDGSALSPLSVENISNLHIKSKSMLQNVTLDRGDNFPNPSSQQRVDNGAISSRSEASVDFGQLLDDFNRSLSQVIEVNHQLKTTLVKSHQIFSPEKSKRSSATELKSRILSTKSMELAEYVSDFEESSIAEEKLMKNSNGTQSSGSIPEVQTGSNSETTNEKPPSTTSSTEEVEEESSEESNSQEKSRVSLETQTFIVSSEEPAYYSPRIETIYEEAIEETSQKENLSMNQYSRDSLDASPREEYVKSHINTSRGDYQDEASERSAGPPPSYKATSRSQDTPADRSQSNFMNSSLDSEFVRVFNKSDMEISVLSLNRSLSESTFNYSSIGLYEKLIQNETNKSEHLAALLKMREKALMDRTKGQIAWLEVQKERYKAKGLTFQISAVKKKQRGILLKMEKEREEIKKLLQQAKVQRDHKLRIPENRPSTDVTLLQQRRQGIHHHQASSVLQSQQQKQCNSNQQQHSARSKSSSAIVRGYELETSRSLEQLLQKREEDLRRRREHVERLMEWHRRLDQEEAEVLQLERMLLDYNNAHVPQEQPPAVAAQEGESNPSQTKMEKKLKEIDRSLRELSSISGAEGSAGGGAGDFVRTTGSKLNKLWRRLTSQRIEKYEPNRRYKLCKSDLEQLYEEAKLAVLQDFGENAGQMEVFLGQTSISTTQQTILDTDVPQLNLNFSSGQSDVDMMRGNYSPCAAEEEFLGYPVASTSSRDGFSEESGKDGASVSKRKASTGASSSSAILSMAESDHSYSLSAKMSGSTANSVDKSSISTKNSLPEQVKSESASYSGSSSKTGSKQSTVPESSGSKPKTASSHANALESVSNATVSTQTITNRTSALESAKAESDSNKTGSSRPNSNSAIEIISNATASTKTVASQTSVIESALNSTASQKTRDSPATTIESAFSASVGTKSISDQKSALESPSVVGESSKLNSRSRIPKPASVASPITGIESKSTSLPESPASSGSNAKTGSEQITLVESEVAQSATISGISTKTEASIIGSASSTIENSFIESASSVVKSLPESVIDERTETEDVQANSERSPTSAQMQSSDRNSDSKTNIESMFSNLQNTVSKSDDSRISTTVSCTKTESDRTGLPESAQSVSSSNVEEIYSTSIAENESNALYSAKSSTASERRYSEENATASIVKSLLECARSGSLISEKVPRSVTNGDQRSATISREETPPETLIDQSSLNDETSATLRSIKSTDNSTNSKHSTDQIANLATASNSSKPESSSIESDVINPHKNTANSEQRDLRSESAPQTYSSAFDVEEAMATNNSNQSRSSVIMSTKESPTQVEDCADTLSNAFYESDFTEGEETNIDDLSLPKFETTGEEDEDQFNESQLNISQSSSHTNRTELEKRLIDLDVSLKDLNATFEKALSPEKTPSPPRERSQQQHSSKDQSATDNALMPDIISEVELRRRQQVMLENEMKQFEHAVPYMYVREIPNKPPPPYVPPAHGSPMTTIFPSEERIKDITYRRTKELYHEILNIDTTDENGKKPPSVLDENITNIYERIILDICKEYLTEYEAVLTSADPNNFHSPLAFFNPPDRLKCMQDFIYKEVRKSLAMDKNSPKRSQVYSVYGNRGKRDHIGEIIIQEMYEEDDRWSNFYVEEAEVLELIIDEMIGGVIGDIAAEVLEEEIPRDPLATATAAENVL